MACSGNGYEKTGNGIIVNVEQQQPTDVRKVKVEVMGEKLIHVSATPEKNFSKAETLVRREDSIYFEGIPQTSDSY